MEAMKSKRPRRCGTCEAVEMHLRKLNVVRLRVMTTPAHQGAGGETAGREARRFRDLGEEPGGVRAAELLEVLGDLLQARIAHPVRRAVIALQERHRAKHGARLAGEREVDQVV